MIHAVLWDLDGTVLDSKPGVFRSIEFALQSLDLPIPDEDTRNAFLGPPIDQGFRSVCKVPEDLVAQAIDLYRQYYNAGGKFEASVYSGVEGTVCALKGKGVRHFITTSKPRVFAEQILAHFGLLTLFDGVYGSELDGTRSAKSEVLEHCIACEKLRKNEIVLVGDRCFDVQGAAKIGIPCIGVLYGYGDRSEFDMAHSIVETAEQLITAVSLL